MVGEYYPYLTVMHSQTFVVCTETHTWALLTIFFWDTSCSFLVGRKWWLLVLVDLCFEVTYIFILYVSSLQELERQLAAKEATLPQEPASNDENAVTLMVRMPDGSRHGRRFLKTDKLQVKLLWRILFLAALSLCTYSLLNRIVICIAVSFQLHWYWQEVQTRLIQSGE